jgi:hypothetical protein
LGVLADSVLQNLYMADAAEPEEVTAIRAAVLDVEQKRLLKLSDLFLDGVNYIDYINNHLVFLPATTQLNVDDYSPAPNNPWDFPGLPNDYPYFTMLPIASDTMYIEFLHDRQSHYWPAIVEGYDHPATRAFVPLTHWVSPWGGCTAELFYRERLLPGGVKFAVPALRVDEGFVPEAEAKINAALADIAERHIREQETWRLEEAHWVEPRIFRVGHYAGVEFELKVYGYVGEETQSVLSVNLFDLHTGEALDIAAIFERWKDAPEAVYTLSDYHWWNPKKTLTDYHPGPEVRPQFAQIGYISQEYFLTLYIEIEDTPDGRIGMTLPLSVLDDAGE